MSKQDHHLDELTVLRNVRIRHDETLPYREAAATPYEEVRRPPYA